MATNSPEQPTGPVTNYNLTERGLVIIVQIDPYTAISHLVSNDALVQIRKLLKERDKLQDNQLALIRHVNATKIN